MSKTAKIGMALGGTVVFLLVTLSLLVKLVVTPEKVREHLLPLVEEALQRKIDVGEIDIGIFSGVSLADLRVQKKLTPDDFISVKYLVFSYKLFPLLTGELIIDQILLEEPRIEIVRSAKGQFNFSDLLSNKSKASTGDKGKNKSVSGSSVFNLLVKDVSISGGELLFVDRSQSAKSPYRYRLDRFNFKASKITLDNSFPIDFSAELNGSKINLSGYYDIARQTGDFDLQVAALDLVKFTPYYRQALPGKLGSASLTLDIEAQVQPQAIESKGKVSFDNLDLVLNDFPDAALQKTRVAIDYALNYDLNEQQLDISTLLVDFNDVAVGAEGVIDLAGPEPYLAVTLLFNQLDLRTLFDGLPKGLTHQLQPYSLAGKLDGRVSLAGTPSRGVALLKSADIELIDVKASIDNLRAGMSGKVHYADQQATAEQLVLSIADQQAVIDFKATNLFGDIVRGDFKIAANQLDMNILLPDKPANEQRSGPNTPPIERQPTLAEEIGPFDLPVDMTGRLQVDSLLYKQLTLDRVQADLALKNNHLKIIRLRSDIAGGEFLASSDINLGVKGLKYQGQMKLEQSNLLTLVSGLVPQAEQSVSGLLQWQNNFSGRGTIPENLLQSLQVKGLMNLQKGQISGSPLLEQMSVFLGIPDLKILSFDALESRYDLRNGLANVTGQLNSSKTKLKPEGTIGVDGALDLKLDARIAPELMDKLGVKTGLKQMLSDKDGWGMMPLVIKGDLSRPEVSFDTVALQKQAGIRAKQAAEQQLLDLLEPELQGGTEQEAVKQLLKGTLDKLFGN